MGINREMFGSELTRAKHFSYLYPSNPILCINSTLYAYEDGTDSKFRNVGVKSSDAGRSPKRHNTAFNHGESLKSLVLLFSFSVCFDLKRSSSGFVLQNIKNQGKMFLFERCFKYQNVYVAIVL